MSQFKWVSIDPSKKREQKVREWDQMTSHMIVEDKRDHPSNDQNHHHCQEIDTAKQSMSIGNLLNPETASDGQ
jgi:hypothetical protein